MNRAIAHKDYDVRGGGEIVAEQLAETFDAPLYVGRGDPAKEQTEIQEIDYGPLPEWVAKKCIDRGGPLRSLCYQLVWQQQPDLAEFDTVILSGNEPLWYVPKDEQTTIAYTHSTPRWQYDLFHDLPNSGLGGLVNQAYNNVSKVLYDPNTRMVDHYIANSDLVARRINRYWNIPESQIEVVYPPVNTTGLNPDIAPTESFYLYFGRVAGLKRVDSLIDAWGEEMPPLIIAGTGPEKEPLEKRAPSNVTFTGYVSETRKQELMSAAKALLYPCQNEDFGMVPIESMASGTPVIGVREGFTQYQIQHAKNGVRYEHGNLKEAVRLFEEWGVSWSEQEIAEFATEHFGEERFKTEMREIVKQVEQETEVSVPWGE